MRFGRIGVIVGAMLGCWVGPSALADVRYEAEIKGVEDSALADLLDKVSELKTLEDRRPASEEALRRRAEADLERLKEAAHSLGYWDAEFSYELTASADPVRVTVTAVPGPLYHVAAVNILGPSGKPLPLPADANAAPALKPGDPARTAPVIAEEDELLAALGHAGHPFAKAAGRRVVIDRDKKTMTVSYTLDPGPVMRFGPATVTGLERLDPDYVKRRIHWKEGEAYDNRRVDETRKALVESGLFSTVKITPLKDPADPGHVWMDVDATERAHRTIGAGLAYNTTQGAGARLFWENRNLFGNAERLHLSLNVGQQLDSVEATFRRPDFLVVDQDFVAGAEVANETPAAYRSRRARLSAGIERRFDPTLRGGLSLTIEQANVTQEADLGAITASERTQRYGLVSLPLFLKFDGSDDLLNPTKGYRAQASLTPYQSFSGRELTFTYARLSGSAYRRLFDSDRYVLAAAAAVSSIEGATLLDLPADKRIYAGGGGSIRAYGYEMAGPLDIDKRPIGGKSSLELSLEARIKITDTIGIVPFVDAGSYYETTLPQLGRRLLWGPGLGLRYYTSFGPIRLDVATPMNRRRGDSPIQVYISLGQAF
ncbi:MAG TPA: autotransporter assembly complex family protein [Stellaceae bacterium]|nr:autotransporter assembly complex family protein [Stellaceae bacterium]